MLSGFNCDFPNHTYIESVWKAARHSFFFLAVISILPTGDCFLYIRTCADAESYVVWYRESETCYYRDIDTPDTMPVCMIRIEAEFLRGERCTVVVVCKLQLRGKTPMGVKIDFIPSTEKGSSTPTIRLVGTYPRLFTEMWDTSAGIYVPAVLRLTGYSQNNSKDC